MHALYNARESETGRNRDDPKCKELRTTIQTIMEKTIGQLKERSFQRQWDRLDNYFRFIKDVAEGGEGQVLCLLQMKDSVIHDLCDFML